MLATTNVFVDTQAFVAAGFNYDTGRLDQLRTLARSGRLRLVITDVTVREIESNILEALDLATAQVQRLREKARILGTTRDPSFHNVFKGYDQKTLYSHLRQRLSDYLEEAGASLLSVSGVSPDVIFEQYFNGTPPFSKSKPSEFPDAFVAEALKAWCAGEDADLYVISADEDLEAVCTNSVRLLHLPSLDALFELAATDEDDLIVLGQGFVRNLTEEITARVSEKFEYLGFYIEDENGDVDSVSVDSVEFLDIHIVDVDNDAMGFRVEADIHFTASLIYDDMATATYDSEDKVAYSWRQIECDVDRSVVMTATGGLRFSRREPHRPELVTLELEGPSDIGVLAEDYDYH